jgi:hypothetical protein
VDRVRRPAAIVGFTGYAGVGKDTAAAALVARGYQRLAFADCLREILLAVDPLVPVPGTSTFARLSAVIDDRGWQDAKVQIGEVRDLLQRLGTEGGRRILGDDVWIDATFSKITARGRYVVTDVRFDNEAARIRALGGHVYRIVRPGVGPINSHATEAGISDTYITGTISNAGTIEALEKEILRNVV